MQLSRPMLVARRLALREPRCFSPKHTLAQQWHRTITTTRPQNTQNTSSTSSQTQPTPTPSIPKPNCPLPDHLRRLMRLVPYPVAIITSTDPTPSSSPAYRGMTVSSFNTVTLTPEPVISFNVKRPSETISALKASRRFLVHLLAPTQETAGLARDFSRGNANLSIMRGEGVFEFAPYSSTDADADAKPLPLLRRRQRDSETDDFPFILECILKPQEIEVNDHTIILGSVINTISNHPHPHSHSTESQTGQKSSAEELCLTYADTRFWGMGRVI